MTMSSSAGLLLRIFVNASDSHSGKPVYEWLLRRAKEKKLLGATVLRGVQGFGSRGIIHSQNILGLDFDLPVVVEIVDSADKINSFVEEVDSVLKGGLVTVENVDLHLYRKTRAV
jgi:uncharacterized protein